MPSSRSTEQPMRHGVIAPAHGMDWTRAVPTHRPVLLARAAMHGGTRRIDFTALASWLRLHGPGRSQLRQDTRGARFIPPPYRAPLNGRMTCLIGSSRLRQITARSLRRSQGRPTLTGRADIRDRRDPL